MSGQSAEATILERLAEHLSAPVTDVDRDRALLHLMDWAGCALAGSADPIGRGFLEMAGQDAPGRAFAWGTLGNILEMDDVDKRAILHCGPTIIPAALALAGEGDGHRMLDAIVRGYEATIRLGRATGAGHYALWHSTGTCGPIGAAAAAAEMLQLDTEGRAAAMSLAVSQATGFWQTRHDPGSSGKQLHTAHAARAGVDAARLAAQGLRGPLSILEGGQGFFAATCPGADPLAVLDGLKDDWLIHQVSFKPWPACRHAHAAIDAARLARQDDTTGPIEIITYPDAVKFCDRPEPRTVIEAKFSIQHAVAVALQAAEVGLEHFEPPAITEYAGLRARITVQAGEPYTSAYPAHYGAELRTGGKVYAVPDAWGDPENPVAEHTLADKARMLIGVAGIQAPADIAAFFDSIVELRSTGKLSWFLEHLP